jgi:hypothetical protein
VGQDQQVKLISITKENHLQVAWGWFFVGWNVKGY